MPQTDRHSLAHNLLAGKVVWITGSGTGLGRAMAQRFAELGARMVLSGRRAEKLEEAAEAIRSAGGEAFCVTCDVRDPRTVEAALQQILAHWDQLDVLVNNAAGNFLCPSEELTPNGFNAVVGIVLNGTFHCSREAGRHWISTGKPGTILNIVATYAHTGSAFVLPSVCAKAGVVAMTRSLTVEWARHGIRVNAIAPGPIPTEGAFSRLIPSQDLLEQQKKRIPAGRFGTPSELAELAAFMVSDATDWMRGEVITLDGGEWLQGAGQFNDLLNQPEIDWKALREQKR
jgi:NAD(P)-dependent dehydrogenase (short-subunit alcohol dehydrogenase family)